MTNYEYLKNLNINEMAEWLDKNIEFDGSEQIKFFDEKYCSHCESIQDANKKEYGWCEVENKCKYFPDMEEPPEFIDICKMWLELEHKEENKKDKENKEN